MTLRFACPFCGKNLSAPDERAGTQVVCPGCRNQLLIPAAVPHFDPGAGPATSKKWVAFTPLPTLVTGAVLGVLLTLTCLLPLQLVLSSISNRGGNNLQAGYVKIRKGMGEKEVISILGPGKLDWAIGSGKAMKWETDEGEVMVIFKDGKVDSSIFTRNENKKSAAREPVQSVADATPPTPKPGLEGNDFDASFRWLTQQWGKLEKARESKNELKIKSASEELQNQISQLKGTKIRWKMPVQWVRQKVSDQPAHIKFKERTIYERHIEVFLTHGDRPMVYFGTRDGKDRKGDEKETRMGRDVNTWPTWQLDMDNDDLTLASNLNTGNSVVVTGTIGECGYDDGGSGWPNIWIKVINVKLSKP